MNQQKIDEISVNFVKFYYENFDKGETRAQLTSVYTDTSSVIFEGANLRGRVAIMEKLMSLPSNMARAFTSVDTVPVGENRLLVNVMGQQQTDSANDRPMGFNHTFVLAALGDCLVIESEIFRLAIHNH